MDLTGRFLSLTDEEFAFSVEQDVREYLKSNYQVKDLDKSNYKSVLLFPPVNNYRRFLIHKVCDKFTDEYNACTFSIGQGLERRTVVCFKSQLKDPERLQKSNINASKPCTSSNQINSWRSQPQKQTTEHLSWRNQNNKQMRVENLSEEISNTEDTNLYRPPALRKNNEPISPSSSISNNKANIHSNSANDNLDIQLTSDPPGSKAETPLKPVRTRRPDRQVYVPRARRSQTTPPSATLNQTNNKNQIPSQQAPDTTLANHNRLPQINHPASSVISASVVKRPSNDDYFEQDNRLKSELLKQVVKPSPKKKSRDECATNNTKNISLIKQNTIDNSECDSLAVTDSSISENMPPSKRHQKGVKIENISNGDKLLSKKKDEDTNHEEEELKKASQEINRTSRRIIKQTFNSNVLEIGEQHQQQTTKDDKKNEKSHPKADKSTEKPVINPEEDSWENMFDESGDCLDPKMMDELTAQVGKVTIEKPKTDYKVYQTNQAILLEEEFPHVLEVSNFPVEFKTQDLMMIFSSYKESGYDIKWVDDTHALAVFSNSKIAAEVLSMCHPFVKVKPLTQATVESRNKAKKCSASLQPYRQRPETCAALARRLVTGALGVRLKTAREERENERRVLNEARERKLLAAKQRDEMWES